MSTEGQLVGRRAPRANLGRENLANDVVSHIRSMVFSGELEPEQRVPQDAIAEALGVSRLPVREALIALESEGIVRSEPRRGVFVVPIRAQDIEDHYRVYALTQALATGRAAGQLTPTQEERLRGLVDAMDDVERAEQLHDLNWEFHSLINHIGGSRRLLSILRQLSRNLPREVYQAPPGATPEANLEHRQIVDALVAGDAPAAEAVSTKHVLAESAYVVNKLRGEGVLSDD